MAERGATPNVPTVRRRALHAVRSLFTPLLPDDYLELINPLWSTQELRGRVERIVVSSLAGMDDGELYLEWSQSESLSFDDGRIKSASFDHSQGFGLRAADAEDVFQEVFARTYQHLDRRSEQDRLGQRHASP